MTKEQLNFNQCIKSYSKLGETIYVDICNNNKTTKVPWGVTEYGTGILFTVCGLFVLSMIIITIKTWWDLK